MARFLKDEAELGGALPGTPRTGGGGEGTPVITPHYRAWIEASPFLRPREGRRPRGSTAARGRPVVGGAVVRARVLTSAHSFADPGTAPAAGNDRIDTLRNIVRDPRVALMFLIPGSGTVLRVNGRGAITADREVLEDHAVDGALPRTVLFVTAEAVYFQCSRAVVRSGLWSGHADTSQLPSVGTMLEALEASIDARTYDAEWPGRAVASLW